MRVWDDESEETLEVNILPMIDVIFAILAFFMLSTLFLTRNEGLPVNLPNAENASPVNEIDFTVSLQEDGTLALNSKPIAIDELRPAIEEMLQAGDIGIVRIEADKKVFHERVIEVMDRLRTLEGIQLGIATESFQN
ncbi:biopolymer transport protein [Rubidibacter lacunae KORDI 51-2]|uniref:Biopolymer transport protein n=1 Tax=Rubidibacter lacunae KORDI 51-2 TaxID=582515 RepID=U5DMR9_9CHRO|nr:biopolymer transporter ExbD [Rubidibacter lacunae]ERN40995.1 biopolymer transport protein [Rubidibacter lacunae KORDI 51-2]